MNLKEFLQTQHVQKPHFVLFGNPVGHSLSPLMHNKAARYYGLDVRYYSVQLANNEKPLIKDFLQNEQLKGVNLTIPFKYDFIQYCAGLGPVSSKIQAVNVLVKNKNRWEGYNTDGYGFAQPLKQYSDIIGGGHAVIFGSGGAARAVAYALQDLDIEQKIIVSRNPDDVGAIVRPLIDAVVDYQEWPSAAEKAGLIVNCTPLGMKPNLSQSPVNEGQIQHLKNKICYDLIYNPAKTNFLKQAESQNSTIINGLDMLVHQGSRIFELWTGRKFPIKVIKKTLQERLYAKD